MTDFAPQPDPDITDTPLESVAAREPDMVISAADYRRAEYPDSALVNADGYLGWYINPSGYLAVGEHIAAPDDPHDLAIWNVARDRHLGLRAD